MSFKSFLAPAAASLRVVTLEHGTWLRCMKGPRLTSGGRSVDQVDSAEGAIAVNCEPGQSNATLKTLARLGLALCAGMAVSACTPRAVVPSQPAIEITPHVARVVPAPSAPPVAMAATQEFKPANLTFRPWGLPLRLRWSEQPSAELEQAMRDAVKTWNDEIGEEVATLAPGGIGQPVELGVLPHAKQGADGNHVVGLATQGVAGEVWRIDLFAGLASRLVKGAAVHELGHLLGLGHSRANTSVMFWQATGLAVPSPDDVRQARGELARLKATPNHMAGWRAYAHANIITAP